MSDEIILSAELVRALDSDDERERLKRAISIARGNPKRITFAVIRVISDLKDSKNNKHYQSLYAKLLRLVRKHMREALRKNENWGLKLAREERFVEKRIRSIHFPEPGADS